MIKGTIRQEDITLILIYAPSPGSSKDIKQLLTDLKGETDKNIVSYSRGPIDNIDKPSRQKVNKEILV